MSSRRGIFMIRMKNQWSSRYLHRLMLLLFLMVHSGNNYRVAAGKNIIL